MSESTNIREVETFVAYLDGSDLMSIRPAQVSALWLQVLEDTWWYLFEERPELDSLFGRIAEEFHQQREKQGEDVLVVSCHMEYKFEPPPGLKSIRFGHHLGTTRNQIISVYPKDGALRYVTGLVRRITMVPLAEEHASWVKIPKAQVQAQR